MKRRAPRCYAVKLSNGTVQRVRAETAPTPETVRALEELIRAVQKEQRGGS